MGWMKILCDTYDKNQHLVADYGANYPLCPVAHMEANAQIEITIDQDGNFLRAFSVTDKEGASLFIPVTEESAGRSSGTAPHALYDNLTYVAGDYWEYVSEEKEIASSKERFAAYSKALKEWNRSEYSHPRINVISQYVNRQCMAKDLIDAGVLSLNSEGKFSKEKIAGKPYDKCIVRFCVLDGREPEACWEDKELIKQYQEYYMSLKLEEGRKDICYLTGKECIVSENHPKGILPSSYGAKIVSANDTTDFTFRGRFAYGGEAYAVGFETTQKSHNALRWLARMQGYTVGNTNKRTYICWNPDGKDVPEPDYISDYEETESHDPTTRPEYRERLRLLIQGYADHFKETDIVAIMVLEAATTGRLSIVYYNELQARDFLERIQQWNENCCWLFTIFDAQKRPKQVVQTPSISRIVKYAFGTEQGEQMKVSDKLMIMQYQRLFHCIVDKRPIPRDFVEAIFQKANHLMNYSRGHRERLLSTACALIAKYHGGEINMEVDKTITDRSYLYGRLLAVYEQVERRTYDFDEKREPNAIRLQTAYAQHPATMRQVIEEQLKPYFEKLPVGERNVFRNEIEEISNQIKMEDLNKQLGYLYIVGYWAERADLRNGRKEEK